MPSVFDKYEVIVGLEVHAQLSTASKMYCGDSAAYGAPVNTQVSPLSLGHPGSLPRVNKKAIEYAIKAGLATHCTIRRENLFARKNYFYADLPKGYQITQDKTPLCNDGYIEIELDHRPPTTDHSVSIASEARQSERVLRRIGIERIHMEEDAGKSIHDQDPYFTLVDLNRAGVPLIEIVSRPDLRSSEEAYQYLTEVRKLVRYLDICDGNMEEGSMRCDANISVRLKGDTHLNQRVEVKNMNSMRNVKKAIEFEFERQVMMMENGERLEQETRGFDALKGVTLSQRSKEHAHDYRYFPEPDLPPVYIEESYINDIRAKMPKLSGELMSEYMHIYHLPEYDARVITDDRDSAFYFNKLLKLTKNYKAAANWLLGPIKSHLNENAFEIRDFKVSAHAMAGLIAVIDAGKTNFATASQHVFPEMVKNPEEAPLDILERLNLLQSSDEGMIKQLAAEVLAKYPEKVAEFKGGKNGLMGLFVGEVMKASKGKADPKLTNKILNELLA